MTAYVIFTSPCKFSKMIPLDVELPFSFCSYFSQKKKRDAAFLLYSTWSTFYEQFIYRWLFRKKEKNILLSNIFIIIIIIIYIKNFVYIHVTYLNMQNWIRQPFIWVRSEIKYIKVFRMKMVPCLEAYIPTKSGPKEQYLLIFLLFSLKRSFVLFCARAHCTFELIWIHIASNLWPKSWFFSIQL